MAIIDINRNNIYRDKNNIITRQTNQKGIYFVDATEQSFKNIIYIRP